MMRKKRVIFDNSFLKKSKREGELSASNEANIMDEEFPVKEYDRVIHDYVDDEFFRDNPANDANINLMWREKNIQFYKASNLYTMGSSHVIMMKEFLYRQNFDYLGKNLKFEQDFLLFLANKLPPLQQRYWEQKYQKLINERQKARKEEFNKIQVTSKGDKALKLEDLKEELSLLLENGCRAPLDDASVIEIIGKRVTLKEKNKLKVFGKIKNLQKDLPTLYLFLIAGLFLGRIKRDQSSLGRDSFHIKLFGIRDDVKIEENTIADFQISLSGLHYGDIFATCDKAQAQLLKFLYPNEHVDKVRFYPQTGTTHEEI